MHIESLKIKKNSMPRSFWKEYKLLKMLDSFSFTQDFLNVLIEALEEISDQKMYKIYNLLIIMIPKILIHVRCQIFLFFLDQYLKSGIYFCDGLNFMGVGAFFLFFFKFQNSCAVMTLEF